MLFTVKELEMISNMIAHLGLVYTLYDEEVELKKEIDNEIALRSKRIKKNNDLLDMDFKRLKKLNYE